jgi:CRP-like cAMP-binding protein
MAKPSTGSEKICDMLLDSGSFDNFSMAELQAMEVYFRVANYAAGEVIFNEGDAGTFMCLIHSGEVAVSKENSSRQDVQIAILRRGRAIGEMAVIDGERRSATCTAETACCLLILSKESLDKMLNDVPRSAAKVIRALAVSVSRRLRLAVGKLVDQAV